LKNSSYENLILRQMLDTILLIEIFFYCYKFQPYLMNSSASNKIIKVVCAIIVKDDLVLVVQRSESMKLPLQWEFPGGKLEPNETEKECIVREIKEELNLKIKPLTNLRSHIFHYPDISIELIPYIAKIIGGDIHLTEHIRYKYLSVEELLNINWAKADMPIVHDYINYAAGNL
jgi:8-oxo-dGTP diphosphatase